MPKSAGSFGSQTPHPPFLDLEKTLIRDVAQNYIKLAPKFQIFDTKFQINKFCTTKMLLENN